MPTTLRKRQEIVRIFYALIAIITLAVTVVATSALAWRTTQRSLHERLEQFHMRTSVLAFEASRQASLLRLELAVVVGLGSEELEPDGQVSSSRAIQKSVHAIGQAIDSIVELNREWRQPVDPMADTLARAKRQHGKLSNETIGDRQLATDLFGEVDALRFTLFQLNRLHTSAAQELLDQLALTRSRTTQRTNLLVGVVLLVAGLIVARILFLLRLRLREHEQTEQALREREGQLLQSSKMEALGSLVGGVAHDFNNLLTAILGNTEILECKMDRTDSRRTHLREIQKASERAAGLTRQLLVFSRQQVVEPRVVDPNLMIRDLAPMLRRLIRENIRLEFNLESDVGNVEADPVQIEQVLINLAVNSRDAMEDGGVLTVRTSNVHVAAADPSVMNPGNYVQIQLEDTGCGMPPESLSRAFDPFFTTKAPGKGTGLGLATVYGIVTQAGGYVQAYSEVGAGTRFVVRLPRCDKQAIEHPIADERKAVSSGSETVLIAEDEPQIRELMASALGEAGYQVLEASDGVEALRVCAEHPGQIDLILSDVVMPGLSGPEITERAREYQPGARIIYVSGYAENEIVQEGSLSNAPFLSKPFKLQQLLNLVRQELNAAGIHDEAAIGLVGVAPADVGGPPPRRR